MEEEKKAPPKTDLDVLKKTRTILISGEINKELSDQFIKDILALEAEDTNKPIWVYINSPGGDVDAGFAIYDMIKFVKNEVKILGVGLVASAAALIYVSVPAERRFALPNSSYLIHQPLSDMQGRAVEVEIYVKQMEKIKAKINEVLSKATKKPIAQITKDTDRDCWLSAEEALKYGLVGKIIENKKNI